MSYTHVCFFPKNKCSLDEHPLKSSNWAKRFISTLWKRTLPFDVFCVEHLMNTCNMLMLCRAQVTLQSLTMFYQSVLGQNPSGTLRELEKLPTNSRTSSKWKQKVETNPTYSELVGGVCVREYEMYFSLEDSKNDFSLSEWSVQSEVWELHYRRGLFLFASVKFLQVGQLFLGSSFASRTFWIINHIRIWARRRWY